MKKFIAALILAASFSALAARDSGWGPPVTTVSGDNVGCCRAK